MQKAKSTRLYSKWKQKQAAPTLIERARDRIELPRGPRMRRSHAIENLTNACCGD